MKHYDNVVISNISGLPIGGASVTIRVAANPINSGALATIYSDDGVTTKTNPTITNFLGRFDFYIADGRYDLAITATGITPYSLGDIEISDVTQEASTDSPWVVQSSGLTIGTPPNVVAVAATPSAPRTATLPDNTGTLAELNLAQTWTANQTFSGGAAVGTTPNTVTLASSATGLRTATFPDNSGTVAETNFAQSFSATQTFNATPPIAVGNSTNVTNLNASLLNGATFASPGTIGGTVPGAATFTTLTVNSSETIAGNPAVSVIGTPATGHMAVFASSTTIQDGGGAFPVNYGRNSSVCTTGTTAYAQCTTVVNLQNTQANTNYSASCTGVGPSGFPYIAGISKGTSSITVTVSNGSGSGAVASTYSELDCVVIGP